MIDKEGHLRDDSDDTVVRQNPLTSSSFMHRTFHIIARISVSAPTSTDHVRT